MRQCGTVENLIADVSYMSQEVDRFAALLKNVGDNWGGGRDVSDKVMLPDCSAEMILMV